MANINKNTKSNTNTRKKGKNHFVFQDILRYSGDKKKRKEKNLSY